MIKKILVIIFAILIIGACAILAYQKSVKKTSDVNSQKSAVSIDEIIDEAPEQTGGIVNEQPQEEVKEGLSVNDLIKSLPYSTVGFTISEYNYANGTFVIDAKYSPDLQKAFDDWYETSSYKSIPKELFTFKNFGNP